MEGRDSVVGIASGYGLDDRGVGVRVPVRARLFHSPSNPGRIWGPLSLLSNGYRGLFPPEVKRPGREADHSPPTNAEVKNTWIYISTSPYVFVEYCLSLRGVLLNSLRTATTLLFQGYVEVGGQWFYTKQTYAGLHH
jgi:hypothetical protein